MTQFHLDSTPDLNYYVSHDTKRSAGMIPSSNHCPCAGEVLAKFRGLSRILGAQEGAEKSPIDQYKRLFATNANQYMFQASEHPYSRPKLEPPANKLHFAH